MAIPIEGFCVVARYGRVKCLLDNAALKIPNSTALTDGEIWRCGFMAEADARKFLRSMEELGLKVSQGPDPDAVLASEFDRSVEPYCEWLQTGAWDKAVIGWRRGTRPDTVTAREGWDPKVGSGLEFHDPSSMRFLEFLRLENTLEVFLDKKTGREVYVGRTSTPVDALFMSASKTVQKHCVTAGEPPLTGAVAKEVAEAAEMLGRVIAETPDWWNAQWFYGKSQMALGNHKAAYEAFRQAYRIEKNTEAVLREFGGVCLELRKFDEAVVLGEKALALEPDNGELLGNLAVAFLLAGRVEHAQKAIAAADKFSPGDRINQTISRIIQEVMTGMRDQPESLQDLSKPAKPKKSRFLKFPWK